MSSAGRQPGLILRQASPDDADGLAACFEAAYAPIRARGVKLPPVTEGLDQNIRDHLVWVAEDRVIRGGIVVSVNGAVAHLINIAVDPTWSGKGVGKRLIEKAVKVARSGGATRLDLTTHVDMPENVSLYSRLGWRETGRTGNKVSMSRQLN